MKREIAVELVCEFADLCAGVYALSAWPMLGKIDWGVLTLDMRNGDTRYMLDDADVTRFREVLAA